MLRALVLLVVVAASTVGAVKQARVRLTDVQALTLHAGQMTAARRTSPVPQTKCVGGNACGLITPTPIQCLNRGSDGHDVQWECKADMSTDYRFGNIAVSCEGYDHPDDDFVLAGSCGVEYELYVTESGQQNRQHGSNYQHHHHGDPYNSYSSYSSGGVGGGALSTLFSFVVVGFIIYVIAKTCFGWMVGLGGNFNNNNNGYFAAGGAPPNTYGGYPPGAGGYPPTGGPGGYFGGGAPPPYGAPYGSAPMGGNNNNFWYGLLGGGLLGSLFGPRRYGYGGYTNYGGYGGGYGGYAAPPPTYRTGFWGGSSGSSSSSSSYSRPSSSTRTASGFGGTTRR